MSSNTKISNRIIKSTIPHLIISISILLRIPLSTSFYHALRGSSQLLQGIATFECNAWTDTMSPLVEAWQWIGWIGSLMVDWWLYWDDSLRSPRHPQGIYIHI